MIKLDPEFEVDRAGKIFPSIYLLDSGWGRILYNYGLSGLRAYDGNQECGFINVTGIAAYNDGSIFIIDAGNKRIIKLKNDKGNITFIKEKFDNFILPNRIAIDDSGNIYVLDFLNSNIKKYDLDLNQLNLFNV